MKYLVRQYQRALEEVDFAQDAFDKLNKAVSPGDAAEWQKAMDEAEENREGSNRESMEIYHTKTEKCLSIELPHDRNAC